jgi:hypothetical protein
MLEEQAKNRTGNPDLYKPWVGTSVQNQNQGVQVFMEGGNLYVYEPVKLSDDGQTALDEFDPLTAANPLDLPPEIKEQIGVRAYQAWVSGGRNTGMQSASLWQQAELGFRNQAGRPAYDAWVAAKRPTAAQNVYWQEATTVFKGQVDKRALELSNGAPPTSQQSDAAQKEFGDQIALEAYTRWNKDGRKSGTLGIDQWVAGEPALQMAVGTPAFDAWATAKRPVDGANTPWKDAVAKWKTDGMPILQKVAILAPFRAEGNVDRNTQVGRYQGVVASGPIEGWRIHANLEWPSGDRYNAPTATTFRIGGPSPTQGWGWDVRQQDTTFAARVNLSIGTIEYNGAQVEDLTTRSRNGWTFMNTRAYLDIGNRNRERFDATGKYVRFRETGFIELGLGADFAKFTRGDMTFNVNGYYELQAYAPDFRAQLNWKDGPLNNKWRQGPLNNKRAFENIPPPLGIDPAFQVTLSYNPLRVPIELPYLSEAVG